MPIRMLTALVLALPTAPPGPATTITPASIDAVVESYREATGVPGVAVAVTRGRTVVHVAGYGRTGQGEAVTDRTVMAVASVSKSMTALAVLQLADAGRIRLDEAVRTYLPEFVLADGRAGRITVRQLLNQTSGLSDRTNPSFSAPLVHDLREAVAAMRHARLDADPGTRFSYHNPNYQIAARLVEVVGGEPFDAYLRGHVFGPLGMTGSRTVTTADQLPASGRGHLMIAGRAVALPEPPAFGAGSGAVLSTAHDLAGWLIAQGNQGVAADGTRVVSAAAVAEMHRPGLAGYGLGWEADTSASGTALIEHDGDMMTFTAYQALLPTRGYGIAVMANTGTLHRDAQAIGARLVDLIDGRAAAPVSTPLAGIDLALLAGVLVVAAVGVRRICGSRQWAKVTRSRWRTVTTLVAPLLPLAVLVTLDRLVSGLYGGRDISWPQAAYLYPTFTLLLAVASAAGVTLALVRLAMLLRGRAGRAQPTRSASETMIPSGPRT
ncbi:CubicO group peptidase (beta-lactamase class C family) [Actinoplanes octamycinicus]|uniref:CubicO group peptidase (Beta-lactamase class C family) n=3 Tax=Actinoplanes octamycinicus TaxID=135948 RepID=A0A7W7H1H3_9ACTN|nr:serine hydrolase domain-containing protein [Actinoplanes octamycinicus]MBB4742224.1 CubicO group peptidase (beta-lactamase class C family) [Actinoplanes octamycinicus]